MKKTGLTLFVTITGVIALHSFGNKKAGSITGSVVPGDGVVSVWAIQSPDTVKAVPANGVFSLTARPGTWKVIIDAKEPYQDVMMENVQVNDGKETSLGEIRLQKQPG